MKIYKNDYLKNQKIDSNLFLAIDKIFDQWLESTNPANEYFDMYYSDEAIYEKKGAIIYAIENIYDYMSDENKSIVLLNDNNIIDIIETSFE